MIKSDSIGKIAPALLKAQKNMGNASKDAKNPFFKSNYANLNSVREVAHPALNDQGITVLQPTVNKDGRNYVETLLLHESGEFVGSETEIVCSKMNDAQSQGSAISYARRYGLQALMSIGAEDDDGNKSSNVSQAKTDVKPVSVVAPKVNGTFNANKKTVAAPVVAASLDDGWES